MHRIDDPAELIPMQSHNRMRSCRSPMIVALGLVAAGGTLQAQGIPTTADIQITGAVHQHRAGYSKFEFQSPNMVVIWIMAHSGPEGILTLQMRRRGAGFLQVGRYGVAGAGPNHGPPLDSTMFQVIVQGDGRGWATDSGYVTIERGDTLEATGHVSVRSASLAKSEGAAPSDRIWVTARFRARYDPFIVEMRQRLWEQAEPHPPSRGRVPSPNPQTPSVRHTQF